MFEFAVGVFVGAAFSPFWMKVWGFAKEQWQNFTKPKN
jgi:hypothetical protein